MTKKYKCRSCPTNKITIGIIIALVALVIGLIVAVVGFSLGFFKTKITNNSKDIAIDNNLVILGKINKFDNTTRCYQLKNTNYKIYFNKLLQGSTYTQETGYYPLITLKYDDTHSLTVRVLNVLFDNVGAKPVLNIIIPTTKENMATLEFLKEKNNVDGYKMTATKSLRYNLIYDINSNSITTNGTFTIISNIHLYPILNATDNVFEPDVNAEICEYSDEQMKDTANDAKILTFPKASHVYNLLEFNKVKGILNIPVR